MHSSKLTIFSQIAHLVDRNLVDSAVANHQSNKHTKGFPTWNHLMCMIFCHLSKAQSIRDIVYGICSTTGNLHHIDVRSLPKRSTLSYANQHRSYEVFREIYLKLFKRMQPNLSSRIKFSIKPKIYLLDSTLVALSLKVFDWAVYRQRKGAMKIHTLLDYEGAMPEYLHLTEGRENDLVHAHQMHLPAGSVIVADRGYFDFDLLRKWHKIQHVQFVVRARKKMIYDVTTSYPVTAGGNILKDEIIRLTGTIGGKKFTDPLRRVEVWDPKNKKLIILISNATSFWTAETISDLYQARWEIELFFKDIKQHLKIKSFIGTSVNAILAQIWTAMITLLLLKYLKTKATFPWHLSNLVSFIRFNLLVAVNLFAWLNNPIFTDLRQRPPTVQIELFG